MEIHLKRFLLFILTLMDKNHCCGHNWKLLFSTYYISLLFFSLARLKYMIRTIFFVRYIPKVSRIDVVLRAQSWFSAHLKFYRTNPGKSTFRTQNDTDKANFQFAADKKYFFSKYIIYFIPGENFIFN